MKPERLYNSSLLEICFAISIFCNFSLLVWTLMIIFSKRKYSSKEKLRIGLIGLGSFILNYLLGSYLLSYYVE